MKSIGPEKAGRNGISNTRLFRWIGNSGIVVIVVVVVVVVAWKTNED
jgi:t-SNARE complex subunit (syntaxin)